MACYTSMSEQQKKEEIKRSFVTITLRDLQDLFYKFRENNPNWMETGIISAAKMLEKFWWDDNEKYKYTQFKVDYKKFAFFKLKYGL